MLEAMRLSELQLPLSGRLVGADASFSAVSTDSRAIQPGQLFIALTGPRFDGHAYLAEVAAKGAVAALVAREVEGAPLPSDWKVEISVPKIMSCILMYTSTPAPLAY